MTNKRRMTLALQQLIGRTALANKQTTLFKNGFTAFSIDCRIPLFCMLNASDFVADSPCGRGVLLVSVDGEQKWLEENCFFVKTCVYRAEKQIPDVY